MRKHEINKILGIAMPTLNEWEKYGNKRNKLYKLLIYLDSNEVKKIIENKSYHRIFHILNRNIDEQHKYSFQEIRNAFLKDNYDDATQRERLIYSSFFKECDVDDLSDLIRVFNLSIRTIKKLYTNLPERKLNGVAKVWDRRFRLKKVTRTKIKEKDKIPFALQSILNKKAA